MIRSLILAALVALAVPSRGLGSEAGRLGLGPVFGVPFGITGKYSLDRRWAAQSVVGVSDGDLTVSADVLENFEGILPRKRDGRLPLYLGLGLKFKAERRSFVGLRFVGGVSLFHSRRPFEFFAEVAPVLRLAPEEGGAFDGAVGFRRYF